MKKLSLFLMLTLLLSGVFVFYSLYLEHELLKTTQRFEKPTLHYTNTNLVQDYLHHSQVLREGVKKGSQCIRPFYVYYNTTTYSNEDLAETGKCEPLPNANILALTIKNEEVLSSYDIQRGRIKSNINSQLKFSNNEAITTPYTIYITSDNPEMKQQHLKFGFAYNINDRNISCSISLNTKNNQTQLKNDTCQSNQFTQMNIHHNQKQVAFVKINANDKKVEFYPIDKSAWQTNANNPIENVLSLCHTGQEIELTYRHAIPAIKIGCNQQTVALNTESQRLASLFAKERYQQDLITTLDKDLTMVTDTIAKNNCQGSYCQTKILIMKATTGEVLAMSSYKGDNRKQQRQDMTIDNFQREPAGSVVKPIFAQAVLNQNLDLHQLKINGITAGTEFKGQKFRTGRLLQYNDTHRNFVNIYNQANGNFDFNDFLAQSNNVYASSLFSLANFDLTKQNNKSSLPIAGFETIHNGIVLPESAHNYAKYLSYYPLLSSKEQGSSNEQRSYALDSEIPEWLRTLNTYYGIKFTHKNAKKYGNYRNYLWGSHHLAYTLSPERESFNDTECLIKGYFACRMYAWILGEGDSRFTTFALAEMFSSIATDKHIAGSLISKNNHDIPYIGGNSMNSNVYIRQGMVKVIQSGTASSLKPYTKDFFLMGKTGTPSVISKSINIQTAENLKRKKLFVISDAIAPYDYQEVSSNHELQQQLIQKLKLHPYFSEDNETQIKNLLTQLLRGETDTPTNHDPDSEDEKRLALVVSIKEENDVLKPLKTGCSIIISGYRQGYDDIHIKMAKEILNSFKANNFIEKCLN